MLPTLREELAERYGHDGLGEWDESDDALLVDASRAKAAYYADKSPDLDPARLRAREAERLERERRAAAEQAMLERARALTMGRERERGVPTPRGRRPPMLVGEGPDEVGADGAPVRTPSMRSPNAERARLGIGGQGDSFSGWSTGAVSEQVAYFATV